MSSRKAFKAGLLLLSLSLLVTACQATPQPTEPPVPATQPAPTATVPAPTATIPPPRNLVVCLGQEPQTLYAYGSASRSTWSVLEAVYDGPFDTRDYGIQPVIFEKLPNLQDGSAVLQPVTVRQGDEVVDAAGNLVNLNQGARVYPAGCQGEECALNYDGASEIQMDQMTVTFKLLPGLKWSDGAPLTAADSVFSFKLSADADTPVSKRLVDRTAEYQAPDELTVQWVGKPGFVSARYAAHFWLPLPEHVMKDKSAKDILAAQEFAEKPLGWGPYQIEEWVKGDHISLVKNPAYFRAAEGLPKFDRLVFRFLGEQADNNLAALQTGECDVVDQTTLLEDQLEQVLDLQKTGKILAYVGQGPEWEHIEFGIKPAAFDDPLNAERRPDFFGDARVRQAFALCMNREAAVDKQLLDQSAIPDGFLAPDHPLLVQGLAQYPYDPARGGALLDEVGWKDDDGAAETPRTAYSVPGVPDGTRLEVSYITTGAYLRGEVVKVLAESMKACGIQMNVSALNPEELYARGPDGPLFGRRFDLAQFAWQADTQSPCYLYESSQIPSAGNYWVGANVSGYASPEFDAACRSARGLLPEQPGYAEKAAAVQQLFARDLPAIPLYFQLKLAASRPDLCGLDMDVTARSGLWNLEGLDYGDSCPK